MDIPDTKRPGDRIFAADFNALSEAARVLPALSAGSGVTISRGAAGVVLSAGAGFSQYMLPGIVEAVEGADGDYVETVKYTVRPVGTQNDEARIESRLPIYGRPLAGVKLARTARVGELCWIIRMPAAAPGTFTDDLWMLTEQIDTYLCGQGGRESPLPPDPIKKRRQGRTLAGLSDTGAASAATNAPTTS